MKQFRKLLILIFSLVIIAFSFTSCSNFLAPVKAFLDEYTNTAAVAEVAFSRSLPQDGMGVTCLPANEACTINFLLRNPQGYELQPSAVLVSGTPLTLADYTLALAADKQSVQLEFSQAFLATHDMGGDISVTLALFEPTTGRSFPPYTLRLKANTPPPVPQGGCIMANASNHYVVCFNLDLGTIHGDLKSIEVNGYSTAVTSTVNTASLSFVNPSFTATNPGSLVPLGARPTFAAGSGTLVPVYLVTNESVNTNNNEYRITITDTAGFSTTYSLWTLSDFLGPVKVTNLSGTELADGAAIDQDAGLTTGTVLIKAPTATDQGAPVSDVTVYYQIYLDASYSTLHDSGIFTGVETSVEIPPITVYIKAWAQKNGYTDSATKQMSVRARAVRLRVNENSMSGIELGTEAYPYKRISPAITALDLESNPQNTIYLDSDITANQDPVNMVSIVNTSLKLTIEGNNHQIIGASTYRCLELGGGTVTIKNLGFTGGRVISSSGGGIRVYNSGAKLVLEQCAITNNKIASGSDFAGAGLAVQNGADVTLLECTISGNQFGSLSVTSNGGGISIEGSTLPTYINMTSCTVDGNTACQNDTNVAMAKGGGIYAAGPQAYLTMTGGFIQNNIASISSSGSGGGIAIENGATVLLDSVVITKNYATKSRDNVNVDTGKGGGIYISNSKLTIENSLNQQVTVSNNAAAYWEALVFTAVGIGGGIYMEDMETSDFTNNSDLIIDQNKGAIGNSGSGGGLYLKNNIGLNLTGITITGNTASGNSVGQGGGIYIESGTQLILNTTLSGNKATTGANGTSEGYGGGICINSTTNTTIQNCSIVSNQAANQDDGKGGGIFISATSSSVAITNGSVSGNRASISGGSQGSGIWAGHTFNLAGAATVIYNNPIPNDIFLAANVLINLPSALSPPSGASPRTACITPEVYAGPGPIYVLGGNTSANYTFFTITPNGPTNYTVNSDGMISL